ncbi:hypothetical protein J2Y41_004656 [Arthrobacter sp. 1088]|uniref:hypothetical protein n=1 Tax=Arthrobacter sp. 1088 TaxID=2817768 RepID=UPI002859FFFA|nr:hypothetical protein [Arthrobacter sp. 1088]MDR6689052.1 hypothetical protein [Arthrobacter sp. 1088]
MSSSAVQVSPIVPVARPYARAWAGAIHSGTAALRVSLIASASAMASLLVRMVRSFSSVVMRSRMVPAWLTRFRDPAVTSASGRGFFFPAPVFFAGSFWGSFAASLTDSFPALASSVGASGLAVHTDSTPRSSVSETWVVAARVVRSSFFLASSCWSQVLALIFPVSV